MNPEDMARPDSSYRTPAMGGSPWSTGNQRCGGLDPLSFEQLNADRQDVSSYAEVYGTGSGYSSSSYYTNPTTRYDGSLWRAMRIVC